MFPRTGMEFVLVYCKICKTERNKIPRVRGIPLMTSRKTKTNWKQMKLLLITAKQYLYSVVTQQQNFVCFTPT